MMMSWVLWTFSWWSWISGLQNPRMWRTWSGHVKRITPRTWKFCFKNRWIQIVPTEMAELLCIALLLRVTDNVSACCWKHLLTKTHGREVAAKHLYTLLRWMGKCRPGMLLSFVCSWQLRTMRRYNDIQLNTIRYKMIQVLHEFSRGPGRECLDVGGHIFQNLGMFFYLSFFLLPLWRGGATFAESWSWQGEEK